MEELETNKGLEYLDDLTGLYNRRYFRERLVAQKREADQKGSSFALTMIDLDNFKPINDIHGHLTGDRVLSEVARLLKESLRPCDTLCRYAGDEFVAILPETKEEEVIRVAEKIKENFAQASWIDEKGERIQPVTCSLGYAFYSEAGKDLSGLIGWADQALYAAKWRGGNGCCGESDLPKEPIGRPLASTPYMVGREKELGQLKRFLEDVRRRGARLVLISGELGVGKTRLTREIRQSLERTGGIALLGGCHEDTRSIPYYPFREAFRNFFEERKDEGTILLEALPEYSQKELARILPGLKEMQFSELERAPDSYRLFESVRLLLQKISAEWKNSLLFVMEDIQWSDKASLHLLRYLARNLKEAPVLMCASYRTEEERPTLSPFLASLRGEKLSEEMILEPLSAEGVSAMLHLLYPGVEFSHQLQDLLYQKTEGSPFFVEELLKFLTLKEIKEGLSRIQEIPPSIHSVLGGRIDSLGPDMKEILACAALVGREFEFRILCEVLGKPAGEILDAIETATKGRIVLETLEGGEERYRFVHSLMADVLCSGIGKVRSRLWHGQVGDVLEELYEGRLRQLNGRLVYHFERGENWEKALNCALRSASQAKEDYANEEATQLYEKARGMLPKLTRESDKERTAIAEGLGDVYQITGDYEKALQEYRYVGDSARQKGDKKKEGGALFKMSRVYQVQGNYDEMMTCAEKSHEIHKQMGDAGGIAESLHTIGNVHMSSGGYGEALKCYGESLGIRREIDDKKGSAASLHNIGIIHTNRGDPAEALGCFEESLGIRKEIGDRWGVGSTLNSIGNVHVNRGNYDEALKCHEESLIIRREIGDRRGTASSLLNIGNLHMNRGGYGEALKYFEQSLAIQREIGNKRVAALSLNNIGIVHWNRGDYAEALKCYEESLAIQREIGDTPGATRTLHNIGIVHANSGNYGEALKCYEESLSIQRGIGDTRGAALSLHSIGVVHCRRGDYEEALKCHEESLRTKRKIDDKQGAAVSLNSVGNVHVNRGDCKKALKCYEESLTIQRELGDKWGQAFGLLEMGTLHQTLYDAEKAVKYHRESLALMEEMGMKAERIGVLTGIGIDCHLSGDHKMARQHLNEALKMAAELGVKEAEPDVLEALSEVSLSRGDSSEANGFCEQLLRVGKKEKLKRHLAAAKKIHGEILLSRITGSSESALFGQTESALKEALRITEKIRALPLLWQIHASLGKLYQKKGAQKDASEQLTKSKRIIQKIASNIEDKELKNIFLNSKQVQSVLG